AVHGIGGAGHRRAVRSMLQQTGGAARPVLDRVGEPVLLRYEVRFGERVESAKAENDGDVEDLDRVALHQLLGLLGSLKKAGACVVAVEEVELQLVILPPPLAVPLMGDHQVVDPGAERVAGELPDLAAAAALQLLLG